MLLFIHLISHSLAHQMFFLVWFPLLGDAEMRTFSPCPEELSPEWEQDNRLFYPQTPANKPPSPALALIPRAILVADVVEVGGGRWLQTWRCCIWLTGFLLLDVDTRMSEGLVSGLPGRACIFYFLASWWLPPVFLCRGSHCSQIHCISTSKTRGWTKPVFPSPGAQHLWHLKTTHAVIPPPD